MRVGRDGSAGWCEAGVDARWKARCVIGYADGVDDDALHSNAF